MKLPNRKWAVTYLMDFKPPARTEVVEAPSLPRAILELCRIVDHTRVDVLSITLQPGKIT